MIGYFSSKGLCLLAFSDSKRLASKQLQLQKKCKASFKLNSNAHTNQLQKELTEYFCGERKVFSTPLDKVIGSPFQLSVWDVLEQIPYGKTISYKNQAITVGQPNAIRAVANANGHNAISILIPCHRVIGKNGTLTGYSSGLERKKFLLDLESSFNV